MSLKLAAFSFDPYDSRNPVAAVASPGRNRR